MPARPALQRQLLAIAAIAVACVATSACRVDVSVGIKADEVGGGEVTARARLDGSAITQLGGADPSDRIRLDGLRRAGWEVEGPTKQDDGGLEIVATHGFENQRQAEDLIADLAGDPGPLRDFRVEHRRTFLKTTTDFTGNVDLEAGLGAFTDPDLQAALGATPDAPLGVTSAALETRLGAEIDRLLGIQVAVRLPGDVTSNAPTETDGNAVWSPPLGEATALEARSERWNLANIAGAVATAASGLVLAALLGGSLLKRRRGLTVTTGNVTIGNDGTAETDAAGAPIP